MVLTEARALVFQISWQYQVGKRHLQEEVTIQHFKWVIPVMGIAMNTEC